ncbi:MAG: hypothetical protein K1X29_05990 [Bdellovibrionales bacterium]|nr:hypothetical protein [Bdellovibrionales bacterium]
MPLIIFHPLFLSLNFILLISQGNCEYRAFELRILNSTLGNSEKTVVSTLDPLQYPGYFPLEANEKVHYVTSWRCRGNTSQFKKICDKPRK